MKNRVLDTKTLKSIARYQHHQTQLVTNDEYREEFELNALLSKRPYRDSTNQFNRKVINDTEED